MMLTGRCPQGPDGHHRAGAGAGAGDRGCGGPRWTRRLGAPVSAAAVWRRVYLCLVFVNQTLCLVYAVTM